MSGSEVTEDRRRAEWSTLVILFWSPFSLKIVLLKSDMCKNIVAFGTKHNTPERP